MDRAKSGVWSLAALYPRYGCTMLTKKLRREGFEANVLIASAPRERSPPPDAVANPRARIAVVDSHPIQYFAPLYAYLNRDSALDVTALYCSDFSLRGATDPGFGRAVTWDVDLLSGYRAVFLGERAKRRTPRGFWSLIVPEIWSEIQRGRYDVVCLHGYSYAACILAFIAAKSCGLPVFMRSETHLGLAGSAWRHRLRDFVLSFAYRFVDAFLAIGSANRDYYLSLGVGPSRIFHVPYAVDNERFMRCAAIPEEERKSIRRRLGLPEGRPVILYASKLMKRKHPDDLLRAADDLKQRGLDFSVLLVGTGEMEADLRKTVASLALGNVVFGGFVNQSELPRIFAASDVFVLPSENEPWGLIVNEAMCAGLPVVVSSEAGCVPDLVVDGVNGFGTKSGDVRSLADALAAILSDAGRRREMGRKSQEIIGRWSYVECRAGMLSALDSVKAGRA